MRNVKDLVVVSRVHNNRICSVNTHKFLLHSGVSVLHNKDQVVLLCWHELKSQGSAVFCSPIGKGHQCNFSPYSVQRTLHVANFVSNTDLFREPDRNTQIAVVGACVGDSVPIVGVTTSAMVPVVHCCGIVLTTGRVTTSHINTRRKLSAHVMDRKISLLVWHRALHTHPGNKEAN